MAVPADVLRRSCLAEWESGFLLHLSDPRPAAASKLQVTQCLFTGKAGKSRAYPKLATVRCGSSATSKKQQR